MKHLYRFLPIFLFLFQCSPIYVPNTRQAPLFDRGGQFQVNGKYGVSGTDLQIAASVTNHIALIGNYSVSKETENPIYRDTPESRIIEAGLGYFWRQNNITYEFFGGYGKGFGIANDESDGHWKEGDFTRYFFQ